MAAKPSNLFVADEELAKIQRNLEFHPSAVKNPKALTPQQVDAYNRDGYIKGIRIFHATTMDQYRRQFDAMLAQVMAAGGDSYSISSAHLKYAMVYDLMKHPQILPYVKDILGENIVGWGSHFFCKMPGDGKRVSWHQDASYWPLTPTKTVTLWLAIDDADVENACMRFISGSHHMGHLTYKLSENDESNVLNQTVEKPERFGELIHDELKAGEMSMHNDLLLHGSEANTSSRRRCGLTLRYCATEVRAHMGWNARGVLISGEDTSGHWGNPPRPKED